MMNASGLVVAVNAGHVWIDIQPKQSCGGCQAKPTCGSALLSQPLSSKAPIKLLNTHNLKSGDKVLLLLPDALLLRGTFVLYGAPLIGLLLGALLGEVVRLSWLNTASEWVPMFGSMIGLSVGARLAHKISKNKMESATFGSLVVKVLEPIEDKVVT